MVNEIRVYVEGGGDGKETKARLRQGFSGFLRDLVDAVRSRRIKWQIVACGSRQQTFSNFMTALETHVDAFNVLLVDAEGPVNGAPWKHLQERDGWNSSSIDDEHCHLMVQKMEAWFIADLDALRQFYGQGFRDGAIPKNPNVEQIDGNALVSTLKEATRNTSKGEYHKTWHAPKLLEQLDASKVRRAAAHCDRLFTTLLKKMGASSGVGMP